MKKRGFGAGKWNRVGGKVEPGESPLHGAVREVNEECGINVPTLALVGRNIYRYDSKPDAVMDVFIYEAWVGAEAREAAVETEEMRPKWFAVSALPLAEM